MTSGTLLTFFSRSASTNKAVKAKEPLASSLPSNEPKATDDKPVPIEAPATTPA
eukprot:CAMPEP_0118942520 /NCGR_PEP_ID=MMETSP1169-20130426/36343_1 /TAXON_ID=36882 /ORGANISM="Pyramimonas obovata, Strain CCMP722" /LENGTH=53 /DNA_ID=CAMNT_0006887549 /DNA_START=89 /DNA_END=247 /DNA_ORIENTATION=+